MSLLLLLLNCYYRLVYDSVYPWHFLPFLDLILSRLSFVVHAYLRVNVWPICHRSLVYIERAGKM